MASKRTNRNKNIKRTKRTNRVEDGNSFIAKTPMWQFRRNDKDHFKWSIRRCCNFNEDVMDRLHDFEGQTWEQIINTNEEVKEELHALNTRILIRMSDIQHYCKKKIQLAELRGDQQAIDHLEEISRMADVKEWAE